MKSLDYNIEIYFWSFKEKQLLPSDPLVLEVMDSCDSIFYR